MKIIFPALVSYTDKIPEKFNACANGPYIRIRPEYENDESILEHELDHVKLWWMTFMFSSLLCIVSKKFKLWVEVGAYKEQLKYPPASLDMEHYRMKYAWYIATKYDLKITAVEALELLKK